MFCFRKFDKGSVSLDGIAYADRDLAGDTLIACDLKAAVDSKDAGTDRFAVRIKNCDLVVVSS